MKLSVLRKVSQESQKLFIDQGDPWFLIDHFVIEFLGKSERALSEKISQLKTLIAEKEKKLKIKALRDLKSSSLLSIPLR